MKLSLLLFLIVQFFIFAPFENTIAATIEGTISLPSGTAPAGGSDIRILARNETGSGFYSTYVTISHNSASTNYTLTVSDESTASWNIFYDSDDNYIPTGYYSTTETTWDSDYTSLLPGGQDHSGIDLTLLTGSNITGTVYLPTGTAPAGGIAVGVRADDANYSINGTFMQWFTIPEGSSSVSYTVVVPEEVIASWVVNYRYNGEGYIQEGYYANVQTPGTSMK